MSPTVSLDMVTANWRVQSAPADNAHDGVWQYIEKEIFFFYYIPVLEVFLIMQMEMGVEKQF